MTAGMTVDTIDLFDAGEAVSDDDWLEILEEIGAETGYFTRLGTDHSALMSRQGGTLLVSFETLGALRAEDPGQMPLGYRIAAPHGWSSLSIVAQQMRWFRDPAIWDHFDQLIDDGFFDEFDRVVFYGAGMGGYAAAAYSVAAPGATVLALSPQATLDTAVADWDRRFPRARRLDFRNRFGNAAEMVEGCARLFVIHDPLLIEDAMHAALFRGTHATALRAPLIGSDPQGELTRMGILRPLIDAACTGTLSAHRFYRLWRARRDHLRYLGRLAKRVEARERPALSVRMLRAALARADHPRLRTALTEAETALARQRLDQARGRQGD